ncbi:uncharacterized protein RCC_04375 [Ramularia collo-cygni]|uniref:Uncharacterized protein n=1 Tax=Ramularia collo-cygni TaxID=112498 RepID=A0A2D3UZ88_9PEZI|nr:uncharacterized protein RCC_04375 [Ramularia collo-cygni]CZT18530.1 uncharacterized protein RCC_04375 [Ramularia collo-cygni]
MNARSAIQPSNTPAVLSISISASRKRLVTGLSDGFRIFRMDNCLTTCQPKVSEGVSIATALDDRFSAYVSTHRQHDLGGPNVVVFYDSVFDKELSRFDLHEPILGLRLTTKWMAVVLAERTVLFQYQEIPSTSPSTGDVVLRAPNIIHSLHPTTSNPFALACLSNNLLVLPAQTAGQLQLISLKADNTTTKRIIRAHNSTLRCISLSQDGSLVATASEVGTLIRIFGTKSVDQVAEFRRGMDHAIVFNLAFSPGNRWVAATSDKGTLHLFDLRPTTPASSTVTKVESKHRKTPSYTYNTAGPGGRVGNPDRESSMSVQSSNMGRSSPSHGSVQEYYGLRPPPLSAVPPVHSSTFASSFKSSSFAPKIFKDSRSAASAPFYMGDEQANWQTGGPAYSWTTAPNGTRKRIANPVMGLPNEPSGRAVKGIMTFAPLDGKTEVEESAVVYVIGGGADARWEKFEMRRDAGGEWRLVNLGFRRFLTRQFAD